MENKEKRNVALELHKTSRLIKRHIERERISSGSDCSTANHGRIIGFLYANRHRDIFQRDIEREFNVRRSTATNALKLMEKNGLITRESVEHDARLKKLVLTEKAYNIQMDACKKFDLLEQALTRGISHSELEQFFAVLDKINQNLKEDEDDDKKASRVRPRI